MNKKFQNYILQMPLLMKKLKEYPLTAWGDFKKLPVDGGIYALYEEGKPIYVGRTRNFSRRLKQHGQKSSGHNSAPFAFKLAKENYLDKQGLTRVLLEKIPEFQKEFERAKERVRNMSYRVIGVNDPTMQHIFELYVSYELDTAKYNDWDTH